MSTNKELMQRRSNAVPRGVGQIHPIFAERAENCRVWDVEGREFLDFAGGIDGEILIHGGAFLDGIYALFMRTHYDDLRSHDDDFNEPDTTDAPP